MTCVLGMQLACACQLFLSSISWRGTGTSMPHFSSTSCRKSQESVTSKCNKISCDHKIIVARCTLRNPSSITSLECTELENGRHLKYLMCVQGDLMATNPRLKLRCRNLATVMLFPLGQVTTRRPPSTAPTNWKGCWLIKATKVSFTEDVMHRCEAKTEQFWQYAT